MNNQQTKGRNLAVAKPDFTEQLIERFSQLRNEVDRVIERYPLKLPAMRFGRLVSAPALDMTETDEGYKITAELPGIEPENVELTFEDGMLRIAGEKKEEREEKERGYSFSERSYGAFERIIELPPAADPERIEAGFRSGVLTVTIPKSAEAKRKVRKISIGKAD